MKVLKRNLGYKLLSLALGILLYAVAFAQKNPRTTQNVFLQPDIIGLPPDMVVKSGPGGVTALVTGPLSAVDAYRAKPIKATVDLSQAQPGLNSLEIKYRNESGSLEVTGPQRAQITIEKKTKMSWTVDPLFNNTPPPGFQFRDPVVEPKKVTVTGLASDVSRVGRVLAIVNNNDAGGAFRQTVDLVAQDQQYQVIDSVTIEPPRVMVRLDLKKTPATKTLLISADPRGTLAPGHALVGYTFDPPSVLVSGAQPQLTSRSSLSVPVDITGLQESVSRTITVPLPSGLSSPDGKPIRVTIRLEVHPVSVTATPLPSATPPGAAPTHTPTPAPGKEHP